MSTAKLLIVEDSDSDLELMMHALQREKLVNHISVVRDGAEALDFLFRLGKYKDRSVDLDPNVILLDLNLPRVNGIDVLRKIRSTPELASLPVVVLTSSRQDEDLIESYRLHVNSYIVKPVDFSKFSRAIAEVGYYWLFLNHPPPNGGCKGQKA